MNIKVDQLSSKYFFTADLLSDWLSCYRLHQMCHQVILILFVSPPHHNYLQFTIQENLLNFTSTQSTEYFNTTGPRVSCHYWRASLGKTAVLCSVSDGKVSAFNLLPQFLVFLYSLLRRSEEKTCTVRLLVLTLFYSLVIPFHYLELVVSCLLESKFGEQSVCQ